MDPSASRRSISQPMPDTFQMDDSEDDHPLSMSTVSARNVEVSLFSPKKSAPPALPSALVPSRRSLSSVDLGKAQPPLPQTEVIQPDKPSITLPGLISPSLFLPIPNTDPLITLLTKYIPPEMRPARDLSGNWENEEFHTLVMSNSWRALAKMAQHLIINTSQSSNIRAILDLWSLRLTALSRLRLHNQAAVECSNLFSVLDSVTAPAPRAYLFETLMPFELLIMRSRCKYTSSGDAYEYLDDLNSLLRKCKKYVRTTVELSDEDREMWKERASRVALLISSQFIAMNEYTSAASVLQGLSASSPSILAALARIHLQTGNLSAASSYIRLCAENGGNETVNDMNASMEASAVGNWDISVEALENILKREPENAVATNDLAVAYLNCGRLQDAINLLESLLRSTPSTFTQSEPLLFNLATLYELRTANNSLQKKRELLLEVAKWSGDGVKATCLKLPSN